MGNRIVSGAKVFDKRAFVAGAPLTKNPIAAAGKTGGSEIQLTTLLATVAALVLMQASLPAQASLIGNGTSSVSATSFLGAPLPAPAPPYPNTIDYVNSMRMMTDTPPPTIPVTLLEDAATAGATSPFRTCAAGCRSALARELAGPLIQSA